ncbi:Asp-tRNA(Asn)/Glu-tRNA(Gln) amidotransferase subunit GatB [Luteibaculum oceani]|uniref:Aspartyl/glutamyl-tRNA(Asn/Gln) amidotransferase subunit B n=1 Tax=Luteibaculum oceani TaxID=1294296 RepID=A0A5C6V0E7_9FLAO|nr:Asp-tRNA(Asn)/Glu-tRNA(Gln) amidotransferase subunit GatB [Luteibaculum oceani]TXC78384.1 Asp-tRNA(Asn)/Glu-tRNA(Gln) amidotransferase subunit GatB [Luteibaculum oceani]
MIDEATLAQYEIVIGLEVHLQLSTTTKAYSAEKYEYGGLPNDQVSVITLGHPGTLPVPNQQVVKYAVRLGLALGCDIRKEMHYARKNYFYADLPKGYQITQDHTPICNGGYIDITTNGVDKRVNLTRIHMEEDAGKSIHDVDPFHTLIDLNRAGVPLLEIVSEPEMRSGEEAYQYLTEVRKIVRYLGICDGNMEEGSLRCDANISVRKFGDPKFGTRTEVKNMNSMRNVQRAIDFEAKRQIEIIENGGTIHQETRSFDATDGSTFSLRSKEFAHDYRYFPEPDIAPISLKDVFIEEVKKGLPELPSQLFKKYTQEYGLSDYDATILTEERGIAEYYNDLISKFNNYKVAANWVITSVKSYLNQRAIKIDRFPLTTSNLAKLLQLIEDGKISHTTATQKIFPGVVDDNIDPETYAKENNLLQDTSEDEIIALAQAALDKYPDKVAAYKQGNKNLLGLFMGEFMKAAKGKADPKKANQILRTLLEK